MLSVLKKFKDKYNGTVYQPGDTVSFKEQDRVENLISRGLVCKAEKEEPKHIGGGWYELPGGEKIRGKETAMEKMGGG